MKSLVTFNVLKNELVAFLNKLREFEDYKLSFYAPFCLIFRIGKPQISQLKRKDMDEIFVSQ